MREHRPVVLKNAHVIDAAQDLDGIADIAVVDGKIAAIGEFATPPGAEIIDCAGQYLSPGWIDLHVHVYGTLGFADPDSIGIYQGVTSYVEAGGPGVGTYDEFAALMGDTITRLYAGAYIRPLGILGLSFIEEEVRNLGDIVVGQWLDCMAEHGDQIRYLKMAAFDKYGTGPLKMGRGLAEIVGLPLYIHIGDFISEHDDAPPKMAAFDVADQGDIITHIYHNNFGSVLDDAGKVLPQVWAAQRRGVLFDIGFGGYNFSWDVAEKAAAQGLLPDIISSDLQQFNVTGPTFSLAHVLGAFGRLGMPLKDIIERVTLAPAHALSLTDRAGSLRVGMPADITVFRVDAGEFSMLDTCSTTRTVERKFVPVMAFKDGVRYDCDLERCQDDSNWFLEIAEEHIPAGVARLTSQQLGFLRALRSALEAVDWVVTEPKYVNLEKVLVLQNIVLGVQQEQGIPLGQALRAVYASLLDHSFAIQIGLFLIRMDRNFVLERFAAVTAQAPAFA